MIQASGFRYLSKPVTAERLITELAALLDETRLTTDPAQSAGLH